MDEVTVGGFGKRTRVVPGANGHTREGGKFKMGGKDF